MGPLFVFILWGVAGTFAASIGALILRSIASFLTRDIGEVKERILRVSSLLPFACLLWAAIVFIAQGVVNEMYLGRDFGFGDSSQCPLPNGYSILMVDVLNQGKLFDPKNQNRAVEGVRLLQVDGPYLLGAADTHWFSTAAERSSVDSYFLIDTETGKRDDVANEAALGSLAAQKGIKVALSPIPDIYYKYRYTSFDYLVWVMLIAPPLIALAFLSREVFLLRRAHRF